MDENEGNGGGFEGLGGKSSNDLKWRWGDEWGAVKERIIGSKGEGFIGWVQIGVFGNVGSMGDVGSNGVVLVEANCGGESSIDGGVWMYLHIGVLLEGALMVEASVEDISYTIVRFFLEGS